MEDKLGQEPIFPTSVNNHYVGEDVEGNPIYYKPLGDTGMNKRFYAACAAMNLQNEQVNTLLLDEDMVEDEKGYYIKSESDGTYYVSSFDIDPRKKYSIKKEATYEKRLVRFYY